MNGAKESDFNPFFPPINKVATAMRNNMEAKMLINDLKLCQGILPIDCTFIELVKLLVVPDYHELLN